jgi:hypothetical protein
MAEDWRLTVALEHEGHGLGLIHALPQAELEDDARERLGDAVSVSREGGTVFVYADTEAAAREAERVVRDILAADGIEATTSLERWHAEELRWEDAGAPLPQTAAQHEVEHERRMAAESAEARAGRPTWEVRLELPSHHAARELADRLENEGIPVVRRWQHLLVGADNEDAAAELSERLRAEAPEAHVAVTPTGAAVWDTRPENPFAILGGLGT